MKPIDKDMLREMLQRFDLSNQIKVSMKSADHPYVKKILDIISREYIHDISLSEVAREININSDYAGKLFKTHTKYSFSEYLNRYKLDKIIALMKDDPSANIEQLAMQERGRRTLFCQQNDAGRL